MFRVSDVERGVNRVQGLNFRVNGVLGRAGFLGFTGFGVKGLDNPPPTLIPFRPADSHG